MVKYIKIPRGVSMFFGMSISKVDTVVLYEEGCYMPKPLVLFTPLKELFGVEEIEEKEYIGLMSAHTTLLIENAPYRKE